jgi:DNA-binding protein
MKTSSQISKVLLVVLLAIVQTAIVTAAFGNTKTSVVTYQNQIIPHVDLAEVVIHAEAISSKNGEVCEVVKVGNEFIPSVQLNEVNICGSNNCAKTIERIEPIANVNNMVGVVAYNGNLIPNVYGPEVTCSAERINFEVTASQNIDDEKTTRFTVRQSFDRLLNYFVKKGGEVLRHLLPSAI